MNLQKAGKIPLKKVYQDTFTLFKNNPSLFLPFIFFTVIELIGLYFIYLIPRLPFRPVFGPIIRAFRGEQYLHYPANFLLLPELASLARMALAIFFGSLLTGAAIIMVLNIHNKKGMSLGGVLKSAVKKYVSLFIIVVILFSLFYISEKIISKGSRGLANYFVAGHSRLLFLKAGIWLGPVMFAVKFIAAVLIQGAFIYAIPMLIIGNNKLIKSLIGSFVFFKNRFFTTLTIVGLPMLLTIPVAAIIYKRAFLIDNIFPESVLLVLFLSTIINSLVIDSLVTVSAANLYLIDKYGSQ